MTIVTAETVVTERTPHRSTMLHSHPGQPMRQMRQAELYALRAASLGSLLGTLMPLVPRAYALLFMMTASNIKGITQRWRARRYARRFDQASKLIGCPAGQSFQLLDMCAPLPRSLLRAAQASCASSTVASFLSCFFRGLLACLLLQLTLSSLSPLTSLAHSLRTWFAGMWHRTNAAATVYS